MKSYTVRRYDPTDFDAWNSFTGRAKNSSFLFHRNFMDYHQHRFSDFSLMVYKEEKLVAVLPANVVENEVFSHQGLTYGGLLYNKKLKLAAVMAVFKNVLAFLHSMHIEKLHLKLIPSIYHQQPAEELAYALFLTNAKLNRRDTLSVINLSRDHKYSETRKQCIKKAISKQMVIKEENNFAGFWQEILIPNLQRKYKVKPVHTLEEIQLLKKKFPGNIRQFNVYFEDKIVGGATIFETETVAHAQYISAGKNHLDLGSLDFLIDHLLTSVFREKDYFDFGISNENHGKKLNSGLSYWKESFGTGITVQDFYEVNPANFNLLDNILI